jgi:hypothetical protein
MDIQYIIVTIIIALSIAFVIRTIYKSTQGHSCESGDCKHVRKTIKKV